MVGPNLGSILLGNGVGPVSSPTIPSNVGTSPAGVRGASPGSANGGGLNNLGINPNGTGMSGTGAPLTGSLPTTAFSPTIPSNVGTSPAGVRGASPGSANGGGLNNLGINPNSNLGINPNGTGMSGTGASPPVAGTNTAGAALSSGLPTNRGSDHPATGQSDNKAKPPRTDQDGVFDSEAAKIDRVVKSICTGC
jgi:hypothetical protein